MPNQRESIDSQVELAGEGPPALSAATVAPLGNPTPSHSYPAQHILDIARQHQAERLLKFKQAWWLGWQRGKADY